MTNSSNPTPDAADNKGPPWTMRQSCAHRNISLSALQRMKKNGLAPRIDRVLGMQLDRISAEADAEWAARMAALQNSNAAKLEAERRHAQRVEAAKASVASPNHISKKRARPTLRKGK
jgi:hypothetical protein